MEAILNDIGIDNIAVSDVTRAELFFGAKNKTELSAIRNSLNTLSTLPIQSEISENAAFLVEQYSLSHRLNLPDALIAATAIYHDVELYTLNVKDFTFIPKIKLYNPYGEKE
jgi:predicted nucleic acid-binding protein